ncbi:cyclic nucleotide-binding domain-containing protein [Clostridium swellfunianum]|uniref:cyclic nucleotide-binding domain-containing protein n=1 Tax=Clostridium swellfunianum TaxID=1367462 RepID=UPI0020309A02|nr:cyclic nucleotide-binding domain-containing protein [Clostridium swellfunianum]MCM0650202.1 cyclic nucleotide-binding domain-containing protein [Clostridium swellfunianum]
MIKIYDNNLKNKYIIENNIDNIFSENLMPYMELLLFKKNEYICRDGEPLDYFLFFVEGKAKVNTPLSNGKSLLLCFYEDFRVLGDLEIINGKSASSNVQVIEDAYCIGIPLEYVKANLLSDSKFLRYICTSLGEKLESISKNSSINLLYPLENRLASYILAAGERIESRGLKRIEFNENLTEVSELLGTSYRHLLRTLNTLCTRGVIIKKSSFYEVMNEESLVKMAADLYR